MKLENVELDIYSSFKIYVVGKKDKDYEKLYQVCRDTPNVNYHGSVSNEEITHCTSADPYSFILVIFRNSVCLLRLLMKVQGVLLCVRILQSFQKLVRTLHGCMVLSKIRQNTQEVCPC